MLQPPLSPPVATYAAAAFSRFDAIAPPPGCFHIRVIIATVIRRHIVYRGATLQPALKMAIELMILLPLCADFVIRLILIRFRYTKIYIQITFDDAFFTLSPCLL